MIEGTGKRERKEGRTYRSVLNTVRIMTTKNPMARSACWERRTERYMTSMVLYVSLQTPIDRDRQTETDRDRQRDRTKDVQKDRVVVAEGPEDAEEAEHAQDAEAEEDGGVLVQRELDVVGEDAEEVDYAEEGCTHVVLG
jgi:hypothetical protein